MKKLLPFALILAGLVTGCGLSEEEKAAQQQENEAKLNAIIEDLRSKTTASAPQEVEPDTIQQDSAVTDSM